MVYNLKLQLSKLTDTKIGLNSCWLSVVDNLTPVTTTSYAFPANVLLSVYWIQEDDRNNACFAVALSQTALFA